MRKYATTISVFCILKIFYLAFHAKKNIGEKSNFGVASL